MATEPTSLDIIQQAEEPEQPGTDTAEGTETDPNVEAAPVENAEEPSDQEAGEQEADADAEPLDARAQDPAFVREQIAILQAHLSEIDPASATVETQAKPATQPSGLDSITEADLAYADPVTQAVFRELKEARAQNAALQEIIQAAPVLKDLVATITTQTENATVAQESSRLAGEQVSPADVAKARSLYPHLSAREATLLALVNRTKATAEQAKAKPAISPSVPVDRELINQYDPEKHDALDFIRFIKEKQGQEAS